MPSHNVLRKGWFPAVLLLVLGAGLWAAQRWRLSGPVDGPAAIVWDKEACAHCRMHIGEPPFAAQLQTRDGGVFNFDDPGCLFEYLDAHRPDIRAIYYRHLTEDRWMAERETAFVLVHPTPMGFGLGAVARGAVGAIPVEEARRMALSGESRRRSRERGAQP